jgi:hypothetical protein
MLEKGTNPSFETINKIIIAFPSISLTGCYEVWVGKIGFR